MFSNHHSLSDLLQVLKALGWSPLPGLTTTVVDLSSPIFLISPVLVLVWTITGLPPICIIFGSVNSLVGLAAFSRMANVSFAMYAIDGLNCLGDALAACSYPGTCAMSDSICS